MGIGDVTGHGLLAALIMLMIQSSIGTAVLGEAVRSPAQVLCRVNRLLQSNIRNRLGASEHATLNLLRLDADGGVVMAGAHEDVIVHRRATGACELIRTDGVWVGLIEARDAHEREFDVELVCSVVASAAPRGPRAIVDALLEGVRAWTPVQRDDITMVALRRSG